MSLVIYVRTVTGSVPSLSLQFGEFTYGMCGHLASPNLQINQLNIVLHYRP